MSVQIVVFCYVVKFVQVVKLLFKMSLFLFCLTRFVLLVFQIFIWCGQETERDQRKSVVKIAKVNYVCITSQLNDRGVIHFIRWGVFGVVFC